MKSTGARVTDTCDSFLTMDIINMNITYTILALSALLVGCAMDNSSNTYRKLEVVRHVDFKNQSETVVAELNGHQYKACVRLRRFTKNDIQDHRHWFGVDGDLPKYVVDSITLERDGFKIDIPHHVYADFGDISFEPQQERVRLSSTKRQILLVYGGSDGAGSYDTEFYFRDDVFERVDIRGCARNIERR